MKDIMLVISFIIGISVIGLVIPYLVDIVSSLDIINGFQSVFYNLSYLLGSDITHYIIWIFLATVVVYVARRIISFVGENGGQVPNTKGS